MGATTTAAGMPRVGLGTAVQGLKPESFRHAVLRAIELRYRHFDTAAHYETEAPIGEAAAEAVRSGAVASWDEFFITSKLWCSDAHGDRVLPALSGGPDNPAAADNSSLTPSKTHGDTAASPAPNLLDRCARTYNHAFYPANMGWSMQVHGSGWVDTSEIALKDEWKGYSLVKWSGINVTNNYLATLPPGIIGGGHLKKHIAADWACYVSHKRRRAPSATASGSTHHEIIDDPVWIYDSAASFSTTGNLALLQGFHDADPIVAGVANGQTNYSDKCGHTSGAVNLYGIRYFPGAPNLISGGHLARLGCVATLNAQECIIKKDQLLVGYGRLHQDNIYHFNFLNGKLLGSICKCCLLP